MFKYACVSYSYNHGCFMIFALFVICICESVTSHLKLHKDRLL